MELSAQIEAACGRAEQLTLDSPDPQEAPAAIRQCAELARRLRHLDRSSLTS